MIGALAQMPAPWESDALTRYGVTSMPVTIRRVGDNLFSVDWASESDAISIRVAVPRSVGSRIYTEAEREDMACKKALDVAVNFAESLVGEMSIPVTKARH